MLPAWLLYKMLENTGNCRQVFTIETMIGQLSQLFLKRCCVKPKACAKLEALQRQERTARPASDINEKGDLL